MLELKFMKPYVCDLTFESACNCTVPRKLVKINVVEGMPYVLKATLVRLE